MFKDPFNGRVAPIIKYSKAFEGGHLQSNVQRAFHREFSTDINYSKGFSTRSQHRQSIAQRAFQGGVCTDNLQPLE
ncbi:hypothetical protein CD133_00805 [Staphylococcus massiliensis CCUG 55927]|uniref:Uncharacterized protein n=1 Tax=Staphylococcus massiliensis S46 TaxID=1229783 RepID=K9AV49_9STAP|nr:hypothetical protein C273_03665 [Staphylococcus massiliensis S46]POA01774.1 hypothetical protein CD133_00805 [Staphylococcus massiliensis CCUG 55927]